jgi:hypothetical protein
MSINKYSLRSTYPLILTNSKTWHPRSVEFSEAIRFKWKRYAALMGKLEIPRQFYLKLWKGNENWTNHANNGGGYKICSSRNIAWVCRLFSSGSGENPVKGFCGHCDDLTCSIRGRGNSGTFKRINPKGNMAKIVHKTSLSRPLYPHWLLGQLDKSH